MPPLDELWNQVHRAGAVKGNQRCDMLDGTNLKFSAEVPHSSGFQLEHPNGICLVKQVVGFRVIQWEVIDRNIDSFGRFDQLNCISNNRERFEPQKVHLE